MCKTLELKGSEFVFDNKKYRLEDFMDVEFYQFSDTIADKYKSDLCEGNELFYTFIQQVLAIRRFIEVNKITNLKIYKAEYGLSCLTLSAGTSMGIKIEYNRLDFKVRSMFMTIKGYIYILASFGYLLLRMISVRYICPIDCSYKKFSVVRLNQEYNKFMFLREQKDVYFDYENIQSTLVNNKEATKNGTVYNRFPLSKRIGWLFQALPEAIGEQQQIKKFLSENVNLFCSKAGTDFYCKRVVHTVFYSKMINAIFSKFEGKEYITGKIIDRYGFIEQMYAKKYHIRIYNYPHGIEYGFKMPNGLIGDIFYATSQYAADYFNEIYKTDKFRYEFAVQNRIMNRQYVPEVSCRKVVFFSEAHEQEVNLFILEELVKNGIDVILKHHPRENVEFYKRISKKIKFEDNFDVAITNNICIARRSTVLVEALYNGSEACAVLLNPSDYAIYKFYPSLQDSRIQSFRDIDKLVNYVLKSEERDG